MPVVSNEPETKAPRRKKNAPAGSDFDYINAQQAAREATSDPKQDQTADDTEKKGSEPPGDGNDAAKAGKEGVDEQPNKPIKVTIADIEEQLASVGQNSTADQSTAGEGSAEEESTKPRKDTIANIEEQLASLGQ